MIELSIHVPSVFVGFLLGYIVISALFLWIGFGERYHNGFSHGWDCGMDYGEKCAKDRAKKELEEGGQDDEGTGN